MLTATRIFSPSFNYAQIDVNAGLQILGGLYIMVRGMDNIGNALKGTRFYPLWTKLFGED